MVGRFVQDHQMRCVAAHQGEQQPRLFAARQIGYLDVGPFLLETEPAKLRADLRLRLRSGISDRMCS